MPKAACPACKTDVKYPRDADEGTEVVCPECDERFVPPELRPRAKAKKPYDPYKEVPYRVERAGDDPRDGEKSRRATAAAYGAAQEERYRNRSRWKRWFEGPEVWFLIFAVGAGGGLPFGLWLACNWEQMGVAKAFWLFVGMVLAAAACVSLGMGSWAWLRKNK